MKRHAAPLQLAGAHTDRADDERPEPLAADTLDVGEPLPRRIKRIIVRHDGCAMIVRTKDIDWIESSRNYLVLHVRKLTYRLRYPLHALVDLLDRRRFVRIHKSTVVNIDRIKQVQPWYGGDFIALLHDGEQLRVSRTYAEDLLQPFR